MKNESQQVLHEISWFSRNLESINNEIFLRSSDMIRELYEGISDLGKKGFANKFPKRIGKCRSWITAEIKSKNRKNVLMLGYLLSTKFLTFRKSFQL